MPRGQYVHQPKHGHSPSGQQPSRTYQSWLNMVARCKYPSRKAFKNYGALGITVCERWLSFSNFLADMGERPAGCTIDRIRNSGNYEPGNCRWATRKVQDRNKKQTVLITINGETLCATDWAERNGLKPATVLSRIYTMKWDPVEAATRPARFRRLPKNDGRPA